jgi:hypothetical protein
VHLELGLGPLEERHQDGAHLLSRPWCGLAPALVDELAEARCALGRLEVVELEVGVVECELGEDRLVVAERLGGRAVLVPEPPDEVADLETDRVDRYDLSFTASRIIRAASPSVKLGCQPFSPTEVFVGAIKSVRARSGTSKSTSSSPGSILIRASRAGVAILAGWHGEVANNSPITRHHARGSA